MILRRLSKNMKEQNWTAIIIEFVLLVAGVFLGIQVANWNDSMKERVRAESYTERLRVDLRAELEYVEELIHYYETTRAAGAIAYAGLMQTQDLSDEIVLINAYRATQLNFYERRRSTFDEIVNAGVLDLIEDPELRQTAILIYVTTVFDVVQQEGLTSRFRELFRMTIEPSLQEHLGQQCGDRLYEAKNGAAGLLTLDYPCVLTVHTTDISAAVTALRADENIIRALRLRNVQIAGALAIFG